MDVRHEISASDGEHGSRIIFKAFFLWIVALNMESQ